jgi:hypothetical protein
MTAISTPEAEQAKWRDLNVAGRKAAILALRAAGLDKHGIAATLRTTTNAIQGFCHRHRVRGVLGQAPTGGWYDLTTEEKVAQVRQHEAEGRTITEMAPLIGIGRYALRNFVTRQNLHGVSDRVIRIRSRPPEVPAPDVDPSTWQPIHGEPVHFLANTGCSWPIGEDGSRMCCGGERATIRRESTVTGKAIVTTHPYCAEHQAISRKGGRQIDERMIAYLAKLDSAGSAKGIKKAAAPAIDGGKKFWRVDDGELDDHAGRPSSPVRR